MRIRWRGGDNGFGLLPRRACQRRLLATLEHRHGAIMVIKILLLVIARHGGVIAMFTPSQHVDVTI